LMLIAKVFQMGLDRGISHYGAVAVPREELHGFCEDGKLPDYYVQKRWTSDGRTLSYMISYGSTTESTALGRSTTFPASDWAQSRAVLDGSDNMEPIADVVETALGVLLSAERVAQLKDTLDDLLQPYTNTAAALFHSICVSLHCHTGCCRGNATKRRAKAASYQPYELLAGTFYHPTEYITPKIETDEPPNRAAQPESGAAASSGPWTWTTARPKMRSSSSS
jgi:hypothetical protein